MKKLVAVLLCLLIIAPLFSVTNAGFLADGKSGLEEIFSSYEGKEITLSAQLQIIQNNVNFRKTPGGEVLGRLQGGALLDCLDETQYKGDPWYHARSEKYGDGYVVCSFAKPV